MANADMEKLETKLILRTTQGKIPWEAVSSPSGTTYIVQYKGLSAVCQPALLKFKWKHRRHVSSGDKTTLRSAIAAYLADNGIQSDLDEIDAHLDS